MSDSYMLVKGEDGQTLKLKLVDLEDGSYAIATALVKDDTGV